VFLEITGSAIVGGLGAWLLLAAFDPRGQITDMDATAIVVGMLVAVSINRLLRR
jgi:hypothetical protein